MIYYSENDLDRFLLDDINQGDLTTKNLGIGDKKGRISFFLRQKSRASGINVGVKLLKKLELNVDYFAKDGEDLEAGGRLISAIGEAKRLHQGWKVVQNVLEWSCGVANYTAEMTKAAQEINPQIRIACTRKSIPGTKLLALESVINGGGIIHRGGTAETILLFANHRRFFDNPEDWEAQVNKLKLDSPEKKVVVEADNFEDLEKALKTEADIVQLDKFKPEDVKKALLMAENTNPKCGIITAGGINKENVKEYAKSGVKLLVTSAPYYAKPMDIRVFLEPII